MTKIYPIFTDDCRLSFRYRIQQFQFSLTIDSIQTRIATASTLSISLLEVVLSPSIQTTQIFVSIDYHVSVFNSAERKPRMADNSVDEPCGSGRLVAQTFLNPYFQNLLSNKNSTLEQSMACSIKEASESLCN